MVDLGKVIKVAIIAIVVLFIFSIFGTGLTNGLSYFVNVVKNSFLPFLPYEGKLIIISIICAVFIGWVIDLIFNN